MPDSASEPVPTLFSPPPRPEMLPPKPLLVLSPPAVRVKLPRSMALKLEPEIDPTLASALRPSVALSEISRAEELLSAPPLPPMRLPFSMLVLPL